MPGLIAAAAVTPDNTPGGYILTFAFPIGLFAVIGAVLYLRLFRPHRRIPARAAAAPASPALPDPETARAAAVAGGLSTAAGGGSAESHLEPTGAARVSEAVAGTDSVAAEGGGSASAAGRPGDAGGQPGRDTAAPDGTEAGE